MHLDVVIPVFNDTRFLPQALRSATMQSAVTTRVWLVDDGSTAPVQVPLEFRGHPQVVLERSDLNLGIGGARNLGVSLGGAPWVAFLDSDDYWPKDRCAILADLISPSTEFVTGAVMHFSDPGKATEFHVPKGPQFGACAGSTLVRRDAFDAIGGFREHLRVGEFIDLVSRGREAGWREVKTNRVVLHRRVHDNHASRQVVAHDEGFLRVVRDHLSRLNGTTDE